MSDQVRDKPGEFTRDQRYIATRITRDGRDGYPVEPGRYRLIVARACPWANRAVIVRRLLGLEDVLSMGICGPVHDARSWTFDLDPGGRDPVLHIERLQEAYFARFPGYDRGITVPAIVDIPTGQVVTNDFAQITLDLSTQWRAFHRAGRPGPVPGGPPRGDRPRRAQGLPGREQRRLPVRLRVQPARLRRGLPAAVGAAGLAHRAAGRPALPGRRHDHRGRRPAVHHAGPLRRRLPRALQVQPAEAGRAAGPVGLRPRPVPDAGLRRHDRLRPHQAALLPGAPQPSTRPASCRSAPTDSGWLAPHDRAALGGRPFGDGTPPGPPLPAETVPPGHSPLYPAPRSRPG